MKWFSGFFKPEIPTNANAGLTFSDQLKQNEFYVNYSKLVWDKIKLQRETTDRYFNYYLLLITTPIAAFAVILGKTERNFNEHLIGLLCLLLYCIGVCFYCLYVRQRVNNLILGEELQSIAKLIAASDMMAAIRDKHQGLIVNGVISGRSYASADFWVSMIQTIINSFWLMNAVLFIKSDLAFEKPLYNHIAAVFWGFFNLTLHILSRDARLYLNEKRLPMRGTIFLFGTFSKSFRRSVAIQKEVLEREKALT